MIDVAHDRHAIMQAMRHQIVAEKYPGNSLYGDGQTGQRIANLLTKVPLSIEKRLTYIDEEPQVDSWSGASNNVKAA